MTYLKNLMLKYLCVDELEVKEHMERAILMVLGFSEDEKRRIEEQRTQATTQWLTKYLG